MQLPQWSRPGASGAKSSSVKITPKNSQLPWVRDRRLVCLPCQPMPAAAASGFSITGAVSQAALHSMRSRVTWPSSVGLTPRSELRIAFSISCRVDMS